jgi:N-acetylmuramoyl-L-alanine amidase
MVSFFQAMLRQIASLGGLFFALGCLAWLVVLRDEQPEVPVGWGLTAAWHEEGAEEEGPSTEQSPSDAKAEAEATTAEGEAVKAVAGAEKKRERPLVVVDAGHGGGDGGAVWNGIIEKNLALTLALKLKTQLEKLGIDVQLTRSKDVFVSLEGRAAIANQAKADVFVSVHLNSVGNEVGVRGIETYFSTKKSLSALRGMQVAYGLNTTVGLRDRRGEKLAAVVQRLACQGTGAPDRGTKERSYTVVHGALCPAVLVECGFISNPKEAALLKTRSYQEKLAAGIARGISSFLHGQELDPKRGLELPKEAVPVPVLHGPPSKPELLSQK